MIDRYAGHAAVIEAFLWIGLGAAAGCTESLADGMPDGASPSCDSCHRSTDNFEPVLFEETDQNTDTEIAVSGTAHQSHLKGNVGCDACHPLPAENKTASHIDGMPAEMTLSAWGPPPGQSQTPVWDPTTKTCTNTYCHGFAGSNGTKPVVNWAGPFSPSGPLCTDCHGAEGNPPQTGAHVTHDQFGIGCKECHVVPASVDQVGHVDKYPAEVTFVPGGFGTGGGAYLPLYDPAAKKCSNTYCHGGPQSGGAGSVIGWNDTKTNFYCTDCHGINEAHDTGAHARHFSKGFACTLCHVMPTTVDAPGHIDPAPADIVFSSEAFTDITTPTYDPVTQKCTAYCHGATLTGGYNSPPAWQNPVGTEAACNSCHGSPPNDENHTADIPRNFCYVCHAKTVNMDGTIIKESDGTGIDGYHINGTVDYYSAHASE